MIKKLLMLTIVMLMLPIIASVAYAGECSLGISEKPSFELGDQTTVTFINLYTPPTTGNVTLDFSNAPGLTLLTGNNPTNNVAFTGITTWTVNFTALGIQELQATMVDTNGGTVVCTANKTINVTADPNITATLSALSNLTIGEPVNFISVINNIGDGQATDVQVSVSNAAGATITNNSVGYSNLAAHSSTPIQHTFTPQTCGTGDSVTVTAQYHDMLGNLMSDVPTDTETFNVSGSDIGVAATALPATVAPNVDVEFTATIDNPSGVVAENVVVDYLVNGTSVHTANLGDIASGANVVDIFNWSTATESDYELTVNVTTDHDCVLTDNTATALFTVSTTVPPVCGNGVCESGESSSTCSADCGSGNTGGGSGGGGGGGSGGGAGRIFYLVLTEEKPEVTLPLRQGDTVKYDWEGKSYSFIIRNAYTAKLRMGVSESLSYVTYDFNNLQDYEINLDDETGSDLGIRPFNKGNSQSDVTFYLLLDKPKRVIDILPAGSVDRRVVDVGGYEEPVDYVGDDTDYEPEPEYAEGELLFDEQVDGKASAPLWGGLLLAVLIALAGTGLYMGVTRKE